MRLYTLFNKIPLVSFLANKQIVSRRDDILRKIRPYLKNGSKIIDIGSGTGHTAHQLIKDGHKVACVDLLNQSVFQDTNPLVYEGKKLPFNDKMFDTALVLTVLHHTPSPEKVLKEAARVAKNIVVMEDTYNNYFQKILTFWMDSVGNLEFSGHPHTNKTDLEWQRLFDNLGYEVLHKSKEGFLWFFESTTYHLKTTKVND